MQQFHKVINTRVTPQSEKIPGSKQVKNSAGGFAFQLTPMDRLRRFLILGTEGGSYYASEKKLTKENAQVAFDLIQTNGIEVVKLVTEISCAGRAPRNDPALYVLAMACGASDPAVRRAALGALPLVARTGTHLFHFAEYVQGFRGWGRGLRTAIRSWYEGQPHERLAYGLAKYQSRDGWSNRDLLRLSHPKHSLLFKWAAGKATEEEVGLLPHVLRGFEAIKKATTAKEAASLIREYRLPRECVPTQFLTEKEVWAALFLDMPYMALVRNLGNMAKCGLLVPLGDVTREAARRLTIPEYIKQSKIHPIQILSASITYGQGHGMRGKGTWTVANEIVSALDEAFETSFQNVEPSGKRHVLGLDISGSMSMGEIAGIPGLTPRQAACAMTLITARKEPYCATMAFTSVPKVFTIAKTMDLRSLVKATEQMEMGATDCSLPMVWAEASKIQADAFVIYTDNETWHGTLHPVQALRKYRDTTGINAKLVVVGVTATECSIADPNDPGCMDVVGFDSSAPALIADFVAGRI